MKKLEKADKKMDKYAGTLRVQTGHGEHGSYMIDATGPQAINLLRLDYAYNGKQGHYTARSDDDYPEFKIAINDIMQMAYIISPEDDGIETFILNNKARSSFDGFISIFWGSRYSHMVHNVVIMGNGDDFALFHGKCNGEYAERLQSDILNVEGNFEKKFLIINNEE